MPEHNLKTLFLAIVTMHCKDDHAMVPTNDGKAPQKQLTTTSAMATTTDKPDPQTNEKNFFILILHEFFGMNLEVFAFEPRVKHTLSTCN